MSVYNGENYLKGSINSILTQSFKNFEFIIVDDCSTDNSIKIIEKFANNDDRIRLIKNSSNIGLTKSLNKAIIRSKGKYIARQDADDISLPKRLENQANFLDNNLEYSFCGTNVKIKQNSKIELEDLEFPNIKKNLIVKNCFTHSSIMIRRSIFTKFGLYDESYRYGQDYELWCRLIYKFNQKAKNLNEKLIIMNIPNERLSQKTFKFIIQNKNYILTRLRYIKYINESINYLKFLSNIGKNIFEIIYIMTNYIKNLKKFNFK